MRGAVLVLVAGAIATRRRAAKHTILAHHHAGRRPVPPRTTRQAPVVRVDARDVTGTVATGHRASRLAGQPVRLGLLAGCLPCSNICYASSERRTCCLQSAPALRLSLKGADFTLLCQLSACVCAQLRILFSSNNSTQLESVCVASSTLTRLLRVRCLCASVLLNAF